MNEPESAERARIAHGRPHGAAAVLRAGVRLALLVLVTGAIYVAWLLTRVLGGLRTRSGRATHFALVQAWSRASLRVLGVRVTRSGAAPRPPFVLACNHLSYLDIVVLLAHLDALFVAKAEVSRWPVLGFLARSTGTIFVDRSKRADVPRVTERMRRALDRGIGVVFFPEATSTRGADLRPFKASLFEAACASGHPVRTAALAYRTPENGPPADLAVSWWGDMPFAGHFWGLLGLPSVHAQLTFSAIEIHGTDRKQVAGRAQAAVAEIFTPTSPA